MYSVEYWLKSVLFRYFCQFNAKSGAIDQVTLGDRPVDPDQLIGHPFCRLYDYGKTHSVVDSSMVQGS